MRRGLRLAPLALLPALAAGCASASSGAGLPEQRARSASSNRVAPANANAAATAPAGFNDADYARHVEQLRKRLPSAEFVIVVEKPFVVVGDGGRRAVEENARETVRWAVTLLKRDFFTKDPAEIFLFWMFNV